LSGLSLAFADIAAGVEVGVEIGVDVRVYVRVDVGSGWGLVRLFGGERPFFRDGNATVVTPGRDLSCPSRELRPQPNVTHVRDAKDCSPA
jgi:hypothetical protein